MRGEDLALPGLWKGYEPTRRRASLPVPQDTTDGRARMNIDFKTKPWGLHRNTFSRDQKCKGKRW